MKEEEEEESGGGDNKISIMMATVSECGKSSLLKELK